MLHILQQAGACAAGCVDVCRLRHKMTDQGWQQALTRTPDLKSLICAAFPYGPQDLAAGPVSVYARGADYHRVLQQRLEQAAARLRDAHPGCRFDPWADASPFPEVYAAALAGLGKLGKHGLLITPQAGSYVFLGFLATDAPLPETAGEIVPCPGCGACQKACPGGALGDGLDPARCLSAITQQRGALLPHQAALVKEAGALWGCDRCQLACPENRGRTAAPLPEFAPLPDPARSDLLLSDRAFRRKFDGRAFTWRGVQPLRRNHHIIHSDLTLQKE